MFKLAIMVIKVVFSLTAYWFLYNGYRLFMDGCSSLPTFVNVHALFVLKEVMMYIVACNYRPPLVYSLLHQNFIAAGGK